MLASFHIISTSVLPLDSETRKLWDRPPFMQTYQAPKIAPFVLSAVPGEARLRFIRLCDMKPRPKPRFPFPSEADALVSPMNRMHIGNRVSPPEEERPSEEQLSRLIQDLRGCDLLLRVGDIALEDETITATSILALNNGEATIFAVGRAGGMWVWQGSI
jgi:hypothetical protein